MTPLPDKSVRFRKTLIAAVRSDEQFGYVHEDFFVGECPVCGAALGVMFHGRAARATLTCHNNVAACTETEIADRLGLRVRA